MGYKDACAVITVARSTAGGKETSTFQTYQVPVREKMTVLQALNYIYENLDSTMGFARYCCGIQYCNSCRMMVNGHSAHACHTLVDEGDYLLEPLKGYPVIKDLVVDWGKGQKNE